MGMWESRVLCEISKLLWKSFCDFRRSVISTAACEFEFTSSVVDMRGYQTLGRATIVVPGAFYAVVFRDRDHPMGSRSHQRRRLGTNGPGDRPRRLARGVDGGVGRDRSVRKLGTSNSSSTAWCTRRSIAAAVAI